MSSTLPTGHPLAAPSATRRHTLRGLTVAAAISAALIGGGVAYAAADEGGTVSPTTPSSTAPAAPSTDGTEPAPADDTATLPARTPHLHGTVVSAGSGTIVITDRDGFTRTIHTTDATVYGEGVSADVAAGTEIRAEGSVDTDGTSLLATSVNTAPTPPAPGTEGSGPGKGGHGPRGEGRPTPPADGTLPTPPADGTAPTPPADGTLPTPPAEGDATSSAPTTS